MQTVVHNPDAERYAKCIEVSKRVEWDIDEDVIQGRTFDLTQKFLPDGLSRVDRIGFLTEDGKRLLSQIQGRTYANIFGLVERYITAKIIELSQDRQFGDQTELAALVGFTEQEIKHQELFRRIETMIGQAMPEGYAFTADPNEVAWAVLGKSTWAVLALTCHIELFTQAHYEQSIEPDENLSPLFKDVFLYHWKEESQHAILDELEWEREDAKLTCAERDKAVEDLIALVGAVDGILRMQSVEDVDYFLRICDRSFEGGEVEQLKTAVLGAYRWQYIVSGVQHPRFGEILCGMITDDHSRRIKEALAPIM